MSKRKTKSQGSKTEHDDEVLGKAYDHQIMMRLLRYVTPHQGHILLALLFNGINALTNLAGPYLIKVALDSAIGGHNLTLLTQIVALYLLANLCSWGVTYGQIYVMSWVGQSVIYTIRTQLFNHLQELSLSFYDQHKVGRIMSRLLSDVGVLREFISWAIIAVFSDFFTLSGIILIMLSMNARLSLLTFTLLPVMAAVTNFWRVHARDTYRDVRRRIGRVNASLQENISGVRVVQSFCREDENLQHFDSINRDHLEANLSAARLSALFFPTVDLIDALAVAMVIWYGGSQVLGQQLTAGLLVAFVLYIERFFDPIRDLARRYNTLQATMAAGERIFELLDTEPDIVEPDRAFDLPPLEGRVCLLNVSFGYDGETRVLNNVNLVVEPGQTVAFVGETGAGKSSLVRLLGRFYDVDQGAITVDGYDVRTVS
ncbi:MAG: ABC transporter ATP-binding protein, partial [Anaerolineae bacterium]